MVIHFLSTHSFIVLNAFKKQDPIHFIFWMYIQNIEIIQKFEWILIEVWLEVYLATRRWKERDSGNEQVAKKRAHLRKEGVLRDPVKGFAGWWYIFIEHCAWKTLPTRLVHNFLIIDPFLTMFMPLESWEWELSNGIKIIKNGHVLRKLWVYQGNHFPTG